MNKNLILVGGGGHCHSVIDVAESAGYNILGILGRPSELGQDVLSYQVIGTDDDMAKFVDKAQFLVTVGQIKDVTLRMKLSEMIKNVGGSFATIVASTAHVSRYAKIGEGTVVMHNAVANAGSKIGLGCIINTGAIIEHDAIIGDFCHISTGAIINGGSVVEDKVFVGTGAKIINQLEIGANSIIGAGAVVAKSIKVNCTAVGVPARVIKENE